MDFFNRTPVKNDILSIIGHLSSRKKSSRPPVTSFREARPPALEFDETVVEKSFGPHLKKENSGIKINLSSTVQDSNESRVEALLESDLCSGPSILVNSNNEDFLKLKTAHSVHNDNPVSQISVLTPPVLEYSPDTDILENISPSDNDDKLCKRFQKSLGANIDKSNCSSEPGKESLAQTTVTVNRNSSIIRSHVSSSDDDEAFENFLKSQRSETKKIAVNQDVDWSSCDSDNDSESSCDSPYQTFYYRVNNKFYSSGITKLPPRLSESDSEKENLVSNRKAQSCAHPVPKNLHISNYQKSSYRTEECNSQCLSVEEFVYSLYPVNNDDNSKYTSHKKPRHPDALKFVQKFKPNRSELAEKLYRIYNEKIFSHQLPSKLEIIWSRRLLKTAGLCKYMTRTTTHSDGTSSQVRIAQILLSEKVCTTAERVRDTLLHEICHAAVWLINGLNDGHGRHWKAWANRVHQIWPKLPVISVCHAYSIDTRFTYRCTGCGICINRHSKSLDITKKICGHCRSKFELLINTPKGRMLRPSLAAQYDKRLLPHCSSNTVTKVPAVPKKYQLSETSCENNRNQNVEKDLTNMFSDLHLLS
ncbi:unnamed protein product [Schistosoma turkestanicum]|nr:unnamed protein product [Schistosoma turkestanicum]